MVDHEPHRATVPVAADLWAMYHRLDERVAVHLDGMRRLGERVDAMETRLRAIESIEAGSTVRGLQVEQARLRDRVETLQAVENRAAPVLEGVSRIAGWIVAGLIGLLFAALQLNVRIP
jgi:hypothetical protein